jgi:hypothetical protein
MYFMGSSHPSGIPIIGISEQLEALVYKNIVYQKVSNSVGQNSKPQWPAIPKRGIVAQIKEYHAHHGIENEESIVPLKPRVVVFFVMVFMKAPQKTMHHIFMRKPSHKLHKAECGQENKYPKR